MGFWDTFAKVGAVTGTVAAVGAVAGKTASSIINNRHKRELENREMALKENKQYDDSDFRIRELESRERRDYAKMGTELKGRQITSDRVVTRAEIMYNHEGKKRSGAKKVFDEQAIETAPKAIESSMNTANAKTTDVQQKILDAFEMKKQGIITDEEFAEMKKQILMGK